MKKQAAALRWRGSGELYGMAFLSAFLVLLIVLVPLMVYDKGLFIYYGDFVSQQLPFYHHAGEVVREGGLLGWDWGTDLGSSFLGSYAFYLSGSPFFWLTVLLPQEWTLYLIPWLLCLKHGLASLTAYCYIRRFVENRYAAVIGGLLYAFSGFQLFNIFFNHFQDVTAFFPLLLISMEDLVNRNRRGWFAVCTALMACINYFFFAGQVVFCILYLLVRLGNADFRMDIRKFAALAIEAIAGILIACTVLMPAAIAILANDRVDDFLTGQNMVLYSDKTRLIRIVQSFFMPPDAPARPNLFDTNHAKWASIGGYFPLWSMAGVIAFMGAKKRHWATRLTWICMICAAVPVLNSMFYTFNGSYYARWYYMPLLVMAMMTAYSLDNREINWKPGLTACLVMPVVFGLISLLPTDEDGKLVFFRFANIYSYFYITLAVALACWLAALWLWCRRRAGKEYLRRGMLVTCAACVGCTMTMVYFGKAISTDSGRYYEEAIHGAEHSIVSYERDDADYFRVDMSEDYDNYPMFWGLSSMRCFQSVVNPSIMKFYDSIGITRDVASRADPEHYTLRGLFSVKYYFNRITGEDTPEVKLPGFVYRHNENGFELYENQYYIPMGFTYDYYTTPEALEGKTDTAKERVLIRALVLSEEQAAKYSGVISDLADNSVSMNADQYLRECEQHIAESCTDFRYDSRGFSANITLEEPKLVFFSVPYETGWKASVNGAPVDVENVSNGFMAVLCGAGDNEIVFSYELPGLRVGAGMSAAGAILLVLYLLLGRGLCGAEHGRSKHSYDYIPSAGVRAAKAYTDALRTEMEGKLHASHEKGDGCNGASERNQN